MGGGIQADWVRFSQRRTTSSRGSVVHLRHVGHGCFSEIVYCLLEPRISSQIHTHTDRSCERYSLAPAICDGRADLVDPGTRADPKPLSSPREPAAERTPRATLVSSAHNSSSRGRTVRWKPAESGLRRPVSTSPTHSIRFRALVGHASGNRSSRPQFVDSAVRTLRFPPSELRNRRGRVRPVAPKHGGPCN
jgi:hypothetical protein